MRRSVMDTRRPRSISAPSHTSFRRAAIPEAKRHIIIRITEAKQNIIIRITEAKQNIIIRITEAKQNIIITTEMQQNTITKITITEVQRWRTRGDPLERPPPVTFSDIQ
jgi:hypothetical protein